MGVSIFPPLRPPSGMKFTALTENSAMAFPLYHNKHHVLTKCIYGLRVGYVTKHNP